MSTGKISFKRSFTVFVVTVPFDNGLEAFDVARRPKLEKYRELAEELSIERGKAVVETVVVGALGSWDSANDRPLRRICAKTYLKLMKKIIVSETITFSRDIYYEHTEWVPQNFNRRQV